MLSFLIVYELIMRYFYNHSSIAIQEIQWHLFDISFLLAFSYTQSTKSHVRVDIFYANFTPIQKLRVDIFTNLFIAIPFIATMLYFSFDFAYMSYLQGEGSSDPGGLCCRFVIKSFIAISFILLILELTAQVFADYKSLRSKDD